MPGAVNPFHQRIDHVAGDILDAAELILADIRRAAAPPLPPARLPLAVERRALANRLHLSRICPESKCQRAQCCRGEPAHCLHIMLALMPAETVERFKSVHEDLLRG